MLLDLALANNKRFQVLEKLFCIMSVMAVSTVSQKDGSSEQKVKLSLYLTKYHAMKTYPLLN
jgi:hypothetical protein